MEINNSANTLFHFTFDNESLVSILKNGLYVRYSLENYENLIDYSDTEIAFPMTSFCDIPLAQIKKHADTYGKYAIGLTKEWGMKNKVSPVIYSYPGSMTAQLLNEIAGKIGNFFNVVDEFKPKPKRKIAFKKEQEHNQIEFEPPLNIGKRSFAKLESNIVERLMELRINLSDLVRYIKPYEGKFYRNNTYLDKNVRFYEEREWRFTPPKKFFEKNGLKDSYAPEYYKDQVKRRTINVKIAKYLKLEFKPEDVRFIIVQNDREIPDILKTLENVFGQTASHNDLKILGTRLISLEQIIEDI